MQQTRYFPFERNRYFYGKLLTVRDFETEQKYFNDKRRLLNRLLFGTGVVSGLQVVKVDDKSVSVEMGIALDALGREIVVPAPVTLKLSTVEGFQNNGYAKNVYLCLAYEEKGKEQVNSVAGASTRAEEVSEFNRMAEGYRLFIQEEAPDPASVAGDKLAFSTLVLYKDEQVRVLAKTPRFVQAGQVFGLTVRVEKTLQTPPVSMEFQLDGKGCAPADPGQAGTVSFAEPDEQKVTTHEFVYPLRAGNAGEDGHVAILAGTGRLRIGDKQVDLTCEERNEFEVIAGAVSERLVQAHFARTLNESLESTTDPCLYLAQISLMQVGPTYLIDQVTPVPFGEYVYNPSMLAQLGAGTAGAPAGTNAGATFAGSGGRAGAGLGVMASAGAPNFSVKSSVELLYSDALPEFVVDYDPTQQEFRFKLCLPTARRGANPGGVAPVTAGAGGASASDVTTGTAEITITAGQKASRNPFVKPELTAFSDEIEHGLGSGDVYVMAGLEDGGDTISDLLNQSDRVFFGDTGVFAESPFEPELSGVGFGTVVYPKKGTFRIGVKLPQGVEQEKVRVRWWAMKR